MACKGALKGKGKGAIYSWALEKHPRSHSIVQEEGQILIKRHINNMYISTVTSPVQQQEGDNLFSIDIV